MAVDLENINRKLETKNMEFDLLNTEMKAVHSLLDQVIQRIHVLVSQIPPKPSEQEVPDTISEFPQEILLLGDENLTEAKVSDVNEHVLVRTINDANTDMLWCWVTGRLNIVPTKCILYCDVHDVIDNVALEIFFGNFSSLICELKEINKDMVIHVCQLAPNLLFQETQRKIGDFNEHLRRWCG